MSEKLLGITIISDDEEMEFQPFPKTKPEVKIVYRRVSNSEQGEIRIRHTKRDMNGQADEISINNDVLRQGLVRFENVFVKPGQPAPNTLDTLHKLDGWIFARTLQLVCGNIPGYVHIPLSQGQDSSQSSN